MEPTAVFSRYVETIVILEGERISPATLDIIERRLWGAAVYDWFMQTGEIVRILDGHELPLDEAHTYHAIIKNALNKFSEKNLVRPAYESDHA
ncbi:MAG TPA: hypothetical protein VIE65_13050 [Methylobacter sp.]|jgi:hypothetical protein